MRAVVLATYFADEPSRPDAPEVVGVYCDVFTYGGAYRSFLSRVPVMQIGHGLNDRTALWIPRPATKNIATGEAPKLRKIDGAPADDPLDFDGDHVIVQFFENDLGQPFIFGSVPHPRSNFKALKADGNTHSTRHRGVISEVDSGGNVLLDTTLANDGETSPQGAESEAYSEDHGNVTLKLNSASTLTIEGVRADGSGQKFSLVLKDNELTLRLDNGETLALIGKDGAAEMTVGDGARHVAIVEELRALYEALKAQQEIFNATHTHPDGWGSTAPTVTPGALPSWNAAIESTKVKIPQG